MFKWLFHKCRCADMHCELRILAARVERAHVKLNAILNCCGLHRPRVLFSVGPVSEVNGPVTKTPQYQGLPFHGARILMFEMTNTQKSTVRVKFLDKKGRPAPVDGIPQWLTSNSEVLAITPSADGMSCEFAAVGVPGSATLSVSADADLGEGNVPVGGFLEVLVKPSPATSAVLEADSPSEQE
jgi:hypothetical protein